MENLEPFQIIIKKKIDAILSAVPMDVLIASTQIWFCLGIW